MSLFNRIIITIFIICFAGCSLEESQKTSLSDSKLEQLIIGSWYAPRPKSDSQKGTGISSYTADHKVSFIAFSDLNCTIPTLTSLGDWKILDGHLIITVLESSQKGYLSPGRVLTDIIISADHENMVLQAIDENYHYYRTKLNTCNEDSQYK